ncbi:MAG: hypothetical protein ACK5FT_06280 [Sphingomonadales bacterium]|jgi:hypothetical protein
MRNIDFYFPLIAEQLGLKSVEMYEIKFTYLQGRFSHESNKNITVVEDNDALKTHGDPNLLAAYFKDSSLVLFPDMIRTASKSYSDFYSIIIEKGKIIADTRNTMGNAGTADPTGLSQDEAYELIELVCKIELTIYKLLHIRFGKWKSVYSSKNNRNVINRLVLQLTQKITNSEKDLNACFDWINESYSHALFSYKKPLAFAKQLSVTSEEEWGIINALDEFINAFPLEMKDLTEDWTSFLDRVKESAQDDLIGLAKENKRWAIIAKYLNQENNEKYKGRIAGDIFGL